MSINDGGPAFPTNSTEWHNEHNGNSGGDPAMPGMSLRQYAAIKAMQGLLSHPDDGGAGPNGEWHGHIAKQAVLFADELLAELSKRNE